MGNLCFGAPRLGRRGPEGKGGEFSREDNFGPLVEVIGCEGEQRVVDREKGSKKADESPSICTTLRGTTPHGQPAAR